MIERQPMAQLCFGLSKSRDVLPTIGSKMSPLMRRLLNKTTPEADKTSSTESPPLLENEGIMITVSLCRIIYIYIETVGTLYSFRTF